MGGNPFPAEGGSYLPVQTDFAVARTASDTLLKII
jgi:hypothetical protein